jgi:hypothetical protein
MRDDAMGGSNRNPANAPKALQLTVVKSFL